MYVTFKDVTDMSVPPLDAASQPRIEGYIRRAERSLAKLLFGPSGTVEALGGLDRATVVDVVVDAVARHAENPHGFRSETDGDYSYQRWEKGTDGFWWPADVRDLFGLSRPSPAAAGTIPVGVSPSWRGWAG